MMKFDAAISELNSIRDFIRWGASLFNQAQLFYGHGTNNAIDEAMGLVLHVLHLPYELATEFFDARLTQEEKQKIGQIFQRRIQERVPAAYITNEAHFAGLSIYVDRRVIIPRSPIAELIESQFAPWLAADQVTDILDMCTGSGCIALACAFAFPHAQVDAVDVSAEALEVADINIQKHGLMDRVHTIQSDLFEQLPGRQYDLIVSNPPYVSSEEMTDLPEEYLHEPAMALETSDNGLYHAKQIMRLATQHLKDGGQLVCEVGNSEAALVRAFPEIPFLWLEFSRGGEGVFLLSKQQLLEWQANVPAMNA